MRDTYEPHQQMKTTEQQVPNIKMSKELLNMFI